MFSTPRIAVEFKLGTKVQKELFASLNSLSRKDSFESAEAPMRFRFFVLRARIDIQPNFKIVRRF